MGCCQSSSEVELRVEMKGIQAFESRLGDFENDPAIFDYVLDITTHFEVKSTVCHRPACAFYHVTCRRTGQPRFLVALSRQQLAGSGLSTLKNNWEVLANLAPPSLAQVCESFADEQYVYLTSEWCKVISTRRRATNRVADDRVGDGGTRHQYSEESIDQDAKLEKKASWPGDGGGRGKKTRPQYDICFPG